MTAARALTPRAFVRNAASRNFGGAFLVYGPDEYIKSETIRRAVSAHVPAGERGFAVSHLAASQVDVRQIRDAAAAIPMLGNRIAVVIHDAHRLAPVHKTRLPAVLDEVAHPALLIFAGPDRIDRRTAFYRWFVEQGRAVACEPFTVRQAHTWARRRLEAAGKEAADETIARLVSRAGADAGRLAHEVDKLVLYAGGRTTISADDVETVTGFTAQHTPEQLVEALLGRDAPRALAIARALRGAGMDAAGLLGRLAMHTYDLVRAEGAGAGDPRRLAAALRLPAARAAELHAWLRRAPRGWTGEAVLHVADAEALVRSGAVDPDAMVDGLLLKLSGGRMGVGAGA